MHNGPSAQSARTTCCGAAANAVALTGADATASVEHVRCTGCGASTWLVDGLAGTREDALAVLATGFGPGARQPAARTRPPRPTPAPATDAAPVRLSAAAPAPAELADLLTGWQVLGATS